MSEDRLSLDRRTLLAGLPAAGSLAGCARVLGRPGDRAEPVSVLAAGSLHNALEHGLKSDVDAALRTEARGSAEAVRLVAAGQKDPDIVAVSDVVLFESVLDPDWFAEFVTNSMVLAYDPGSEGGERLAAAGPEEWYRPLLDGETSLGRTDPDLDPLGYRTLFVLELATGHYDLGVDLRTAVPDGAGVYPETQLLSQFETGGIDAAFTYRNMAVERGYDYVDLPAPVDLGDPAYADRYETASYELPDGTVASGGAVSYAATLRHQSPAAVDVFGSLTAGQYLTDFGFGVPETYPRYTGNVPDEVTD
jgi:molybdate/tungstate transport system substrate-binding protein